MTKHLKRIAVVGFALVAGTSTVACAADQYGLAYTDTIAQDGVKIQSTHGQVTQSGTSVTAASLAATLARMSFAQQTALQINGTSQPVILRRIFPAGDGGISDQTYVLFSLQPCRKVEHDADDANRLLCRDQPAASPMFEFGKVVLAAGHSVTVTFPLGVTWAYQLSEPDPLRAR